MNRIRFSSPLSRIAPLLALAFVLGAAAPAQAWTSAPRPHGAPSVVFGARVPFADVVWVIGGGGHRVAAHFGPPPRIRTYEADPYYEGYRDGYHQAARRRDAARYRAGRARGYRDGRGASCRGR